MHRSRLHPQKHKTSQEQVQLTWAVVVEKKGEEQAVEALHEMVKQEPGMGEVEQKEREAEKMEEERPGWRSRCARRRTRG